MQNLINWQKIVILSKVISALIQMLGGGGGGVQPWKEILARRAQPPWAHSWAVDTILSILAIAVNNKSIELCSKNYGRFSYRFSVFFFVRHMVDDNILIDCNFWETVFTVDPIPLSWNEF